MTAQIKHITYELLCPYCGFRDLVHTTILNSLLPLYACPECGEKMDVIEEEVTNDHTGKRPH